MTTLTVVLVALSSVGTALAQEADPSVLKDLIEDYESAIRSGDVSGSKIKTKLATGFTATLPNGVVVKSYGELGKAENALRTMIGRGTVYQPSIVALESIYGNGSVVAVTGSTINDATAQGGKQRRFTTFWTAVVQFDSGHWKLVRHQAVMDPSINPWPSEGGSSGGGWLWPLLIGGVVGLVVGFLGATLLAKFSGPAAAPAAASPITKTPTGKTRAWDSEGGTPDTEADPPLSSSSPSAEGDRKRAWDVATPETPAATEPPDDSPPSSRKRAWDQ